MRQCKNQLQQQQPQTQLSAAKFLIGASTANVPNREQQSNRWVKATCYRFGRKGHIATTSTESTKENDTPIVEQQQEEETNLMHEHPETEEFDFDNDLEEEMEHGFHFTQYSMWNVFTEDQTKSKTNSTA